MPNPVTKLLINGSVAASAQGMPPTLQVQGLSPDTSYNAKVQYDPDDGSTPIESSVQGIRTLPAGTFSVSNTYIENDASTGHAILTFDFTSTYAVSSIQVRYSGTDYQGSISGGKCTVELPTGLQYTSITFDINAIDIYAETFRVGQSGVYVEEAMSKQPFFVQLIDPTENQGNVQIIKNGNPTSLNLEYSTDGTNWDTYTMGDYISLTSVKPRVWFRNTGTTRFSTSDSDYYLISPAGMSVGGAEVGGNIASLKSKDLSNTTSNEFDFCKLFDSRTSIGKASRLYLGNYRMLGGNCYRRMFKGCSYLIETPELSTTVLAAQCYYEMFRDCVSLEKAPELPASRSLEAYCYYGMFHGCTSLEKAPELPATTMASNCYTSMFNGCTALKEAPELPATTLNQSCYEHMFYGCTSLEKAPELPAITLANRCYYSMFRECTSLEKAPELPATTLVYLCYGYMFSNCTSLKEITCLAEDVSATQCLYNWVNGVAATGTFTKSPNMSSWPTGMDGIPSGWTVQDYQ